MIIISYYTQSVSTCGFGNRAQTTPGVRVVIIYDIQSRCFIPFNTDESNNGFAFIDKLSSSAIAIGPVPSSLKIRWIRTKWNRRVGRAAKYYFDIISWARKSKMYSDPSGFTRQFFGPAIPWARQTVSCDLPVRLCNIEIGFAFAFV